MAARYGAAMTPTSTLDLPFIAPILSLLRQSLIPSTPTIVVAVVTLIVFALFLAMTYGKPRRSNGLSASTNRLIGSVLYLVAHLAVIGICWKIWGIGMFEESIFYMAHLNARMLVRIMLIASGIWNH